MTYEQIVEIAAKAISGAPFPSKASKAKASAVIAVIAEALKEPTPDQFEEFYHPMRDFLNVGGHNFDQDYLLKEAFIIALSPLHKEDEK